MSDATAILTAARAHFDNMRGKEITVPEWGSEDAPLVAFYDPPTLALRQNIERRGGKSEARKLATVVILSLKDADGKVIFKDDAPTLNTFENNLDPAVVSRIAAQILGLSGEDELGN